MTGPHMQRTPEGDAVQTFVVMPKAEGWIYFDELKPKIAHSRLAFMAMKFGDETLDKLFSEVLKPAMALTGFDLRRVSDDPRAGLIDDRIRVDIRNSRFWVKKPAETRFCQYPPRKDRNSASRR